LNVPLRRADDVAAAERLEAGFGVLEQGAGEKHGDDRHVPGGQDPIENRRLAIEIERADRIADVEADQQAERDEEGRRHLQAGGDKEHHREHHGDFERTRFDENDRTAGAEQPEHPKLNRPDSCDRVRKLQRCSAGGCEAGHRANPQSSGACSSGRASADPARGRYALVPARLSRQP